MPGFGAIGELAIGEVSVGTGGGAEFIGPDKYMQPLSMPPRFRPGVKPSAQQFFAFNPQPIVSFSWMMALAEPVRARPRSPAALAPSFFFQPTPSPFVATGWFSPLSEPVRKRPGLPAPAQQFTAYQANPTTVTPFAWFAALSEPVRARRALPAALVPFFAIDPQVIPLGRVMPWFSPLSEPVRFKVGLRPSLQQFYAAPPRILPNPQLFGVLGALETKDTFLGGAALFNRPTDAEIGVINTTPQPAEVGISATGTATGVITVRISIIVG